MQQTPLFDQYALSGAKVVDFNGWALPVQFTGIIDEHEHTRKAAGLFDCSHMGEFLLKGEEAIAGFDRLIFSEIMALKVGPCRYSAFLNENGGIIDDCVALKLAEDELYIITNAGPLQRISALIQENCPGAIDVSKATTKIDIQGPTSRDALLAIGMEDIRHMRYWRGGRVQWQGAELIVSRAGYTGELGYELYVPNCVGTKLWQALLAVEDVKPCGLGARDTLRLETGKPLNGEDLSETTTPMEAGMTPLIRWEKDFVGKAALEAKRDAGGFRVLTQIQSASRRAPRHDFEVKHKGEVVGSVSSGTFGPSVGTGVGLAYIDAAHTAVGTELTAGPRDMEIKVAPNPVYTEGTCRMKFD